MKWIFILMASALTALGQYSVGTALRNVDGSNWVNYGQMVISIVQVKHLTPSSAYQYQVTGVVEYPHVDDYTTNHIVTNLVNTAPAAMFTSTGIPIGYWPNGTNGAYTLTNYGDYIIITNYWLAIPGKLVELNNGSPYLSSEVHINGLVIHGTPMGFTAVKNGAIPLRNVTILAIKSSGDLINWTTTNLSAYPFVGSNFYKAEITVIP